MKTLISLFALFICVLPLWADDDFTIVAKTNIVTDPDYIRVLDDKVCDTRGNAEWTSISGTIVAKYTNGIVIQTYVTVRDKQESQSLTYNQSVGAQGGYMMVPTYSYKESKKVFVKNLYSLDGRTQAFAAKKDGFIEIQGQRFESYDFGFLHRYPKVFTKKLFGKHVAAANSTNATTVSSP